MKPANNIVLDSSAVLALILKERGGDRVGDLLESLEADDTIQVAIGSVNWCEILTRLYRDHDSMAPLALDAVLANVEHLPFAKQQAELAAKYSRTYPELSLGDRACLALAVLRDATVWTTDRAWSKVRLGVAVEFIR